MSGLKADYWLDSDYIVALPSPSSSNTRPIPRKLLLPHRTEDIEPGLPRKGVCASDHVMIGAEFEL